MIAEITVGWNSLKAAKDIVQGLQALKTEAAVNEAKVALQSYILEAQQSLFAAQEVQAAAAQRVDDLEAEIVRLKDWSGERERYELKSVGPGSFAYMLKPGMRGSDPAHWLCTNCFDNGKKSFFQNQGAKKDDQTHNVYACSVCKTTMVAHFRTRPHYSEEV